MTTIGWIAAIAGIGFVLGHLARWFADGMAVNLQLYFHAFRLSYVTSPWVVAPMRFLSSGVLQLSALACWSIGWGYFAATRPKSSRLYVAAIVVGVLSGTALTTTPVRAAQPQFFTDSWWAVLNPIVAAAACLIPFAIVARTRPRAAPAGSLALSFGFAALGLSWWTVNDVSYAIATGCVPGASLAAAVCPAPEFQWGLMTVSVLVAPVVYMMLQSRTGTFTAASCSVPMPSLPIRKSISGLWRKWRSGAKRTSSQPGTASQAAIARITLWGE